MVELGLVTLDQEKLKRLMDAMSIKPAMQDIILNLHDTQRTMEKMLADLLDQQQKVIAALSLVNKGFGQYATRLQQIEKKYGVGAVNDIVVHESANDG